MVPQQKKKKCQPSLHTHKKNKFPFIFFYVGFWCKIVEDSRVKNKVTKIK